MSEENKYSQLKQFGRLLWPSATEVAVYSAVALMFLTVGALTVFKNYLGSEAETFTLGDLIPENLSELINQIQSHTSVPTLATAFFWAGVGGVVYILLWFVANAIIGVRNDVVVIENYLKPAHSGEVPRAWHEFLESLALRLAGAAAILGFTVLTLSLLLPVYMGMFRGAVMHWQQLNYLGNGLLGVFGLIVVFHVYVILLRLVLLRVRVFS